MQLQKISFDVGMNGDDSLSRLQPGEYFNALNFRGGSSERGHISGLQTIPGTTLLYNTLPGGQNYCIGGCEDEGNSQLFWFNYNSDGNHGIYCYDQNANTTTAVLLSSQVTGGFGWAEFTYIHSCFIVNRNIYWTDNVMPRRINVDAGMNLNNDVTPPVVGTFNDIVDVPNTQTEGGGGLTSVFSLAAGTIAYGSGVSCQLIRNGLARVTFPVPLDWTSFPTTPYQNIIFNGLQAFLTTKAASGPGTWTLSLSGETITLFVTSGWDMGTGDFSLPTYLELDLFTVENVYGITPYVYTAPISQAVLAWIRRPPAYAPSQIKVLENPVPSSNFIGDQAFQFCWRYMFKDSEQSTLSPLSDTAGFNEQDPPPTQNFLNFTSPSLSTRGYLATSYNLPTETQAATAGVPYGPGMFAQLIRVGTGGPDAAATVVNIPLDWSVYPAKDYNYVIVKGLANYFSQLPGSDNPGILTNGDPPQSAGYTSAKWYISSRDGLHPTLNILATWDWGLGDSSFPPTVQCELLLFTQTAAASRQYSLINVTLPLAEVIDQDVVQVDLVAAYLVSGTYYVIKSWRKALAADAVSIAQHNNGTPLTYAFRNNQLGIALDSAYSVKQNDAVPIWAGTAELAKNRAHLGNIINGYDSASLPTSLQLTPVVQVVGSAAKSVIQGEWIFVQWSYFGVTLAHYVIRTTVPATGQPPGSAYYYYWILNAKPPFPVSISSGLEFIGTDVFDVYTFFGQSIDPQFIPGPISDTGDTSAITISNNSSQFSILGTAFKSNAFYQATVTFYDDWQRHGGTVTTDGLRFTTPNTAFSANSWVTAILWALSNANAQNEIPASAAYFSVGLTKCLRTRYFVQAIGFVSYASIDLSTQVISYNNNTYAANLYGIAINIEYLTSNGMGYTYNQGDACDFYLAGVYYSLEIMSAQDGYIVCELRNIGTLGSSALAQYEIYTPYKQQSNEPSYEQGKLYPIISPGTAGRQYGILSGSISGDVWLFQRGGITNYVAEAMSPNNKFYLQWITNAGRPNFADFIGQVNKTMSLAFSNTFVQGSQVNGLSAFDATDTVDLSQEFGDLQKLKLASKIQKEGSVMLAICIRETVSLYLAETQVAAPEGNAFLAVSASVIGTIYPLQKSLGTLHPESVVLFRGNVYWVDVNNGGPVMYSDNGLELITKKMHAFWRNWCLLYKSLSQSQIAAFGSRPFIVGGVDAFNEEILFTLPALSASALKGTLPGYTNNAPNNLFDCFDGLAKTMVYKIKKDYWNPPLSLTGEAYLLLGNQVYSFKNGALWLCNDLNAAANNFFGTAYAAFIMFACNELPDVPKLPLFINVESDTTPGWLIEYSDYPNVQITDIEGEEWNNKEGVFYKPIFRDRLTPRFTDVNQALLYGDKVIGKSPMFQLCFGLTGPGELPVVGYCQLKYVNVGYEFSSGHKTIPEK